MIEARTARHDGAYVAVLTTAAFGVRLQHLFSTAEPTGWDGYSYVVQVQRLVERGELHWPDASWVWWCLAAPHALGVPSILSVKVMAAMMTALGVPAAWWAGRAWAGRGAGWGLALWVASSPSVMHLTADFPKNAALLAPLFCVAALLRTTTRAGRVGLAGAVLLAATAHRMGAVLLLVLAAGACLGILWQRSTGSRALRNGGAVALICCGIFAAASWSAPGLFTLADLERVSPQLSRTPTFLPFTYFALRATAWPEQLELCLPWFALPVAMWCAVRRPALRPVLCAVCAVLAVCLFPFWRGDQLDLGYRLGLISPGFALLSLLISAEPRDAPRALGWVTLPLVLLTRSGFDVTQGPPYEGWRAVIRAMPRPLPDLLIAPPGFAFLYDAETGAEAMAWAPEPALDRTHVWRLAFGMRDGEWLEWLSEPTAPVTRLDGNTVLIREDDWERFSTKARSEGDDDVRRRLDDWRNPSQVRSGAMLERHGLTK